MINPGAESTRVRMAVGDANRLFSLLHHFEFDFSSSTFKFLFRKRFQLINWQQIQLFLVFFCCIVNYKRERKLGEIRKWRLLCVSAAAAAWMQGPEAVSQTGGQLWTSGSFNLVVFACHLTGPDFPDGQGHQKKPWRQNSWIEEKKFQWFSGNENTRRFIECYKIWF